MEIRYHNQGEYEKWFRRISEDEQAKILRRLIALAEFGSNLGTPAVRPIVGTRIRELRSGKYRLYFMIERDAITFLAYGDKDSQHRDIRQALERMT